MPSYLPENNTPLATDNEMRSLQKVVSLLSGSAAAVAATGDNYRFSGSGAATILALENKDTALYNRIDSVGADGAQQIEIQTGVA